MKHLIIFSIFINFSWILCNLEPLHIDSHIIEDEQGELDFIGYWLFQNNYLENEVKGFPKPEPEQTPPPFPSNEECAHRIYSGCNYPTTFTDEELENVRQFLNYSFTVLADIKPDKPLCHKLYVRQDWKCLSQQQKERVTKVWKTMYDSKDIQSLTDLHIKSWPAWHKSGEFLASHRYLVNELEIVMRTIDPGVTLPYWDPYTCGCQPERSSIWDTLGHSGNYTNGYKVCDGIYGRMELVPSVKRHWSPRGTIYPWFTQEFITHAIQTSSSFIDITMNALGLHFPPHLNVGGYEGQYSLRDAPYDLLFYLHHNAAVDNIVLRWQFMKKENLAPLSYNKLNSRINPLAGNIERLNIFTDTLTGVPSVTIKELFWVGFGDLCSITDQLIRPINNLWKGIKDQKPSAVRRLPQWILEKYFPAFVSGNFSGLSHTFEEVGECNARCLPITKPTFVVETENGRRQLRAYSFDGGFDHQVEFEMMETKLYKMWLDLNRAGYCSPYVTTY